jgi:16S rRNA (cytosine1402-N4)-methyltransferase
MTSPFVHRPVLLERVVELLSRVPAGVVVDATVGGGGHARALLEANERLTVVGLDQDTDALEAARQALSGFGGRIVLRHARFDTLTTTLQELGHDSVVGVLFDLGVSSPQLDRPERGFSYRSDAALDMRMDRSQPRTAADIVNGYDEADLRRVLRDHGDERHAGRIARAIVAARPIATTGELAEVVRDAIPAPARRRGGHPAKRSFQAIRIEVNRELDVLETALEQAIDLLEAGGRCVAIAYHSGEDRIVKDTFRRASTGGCSCPPGLPCTCGARATVRLLKRGAWKADAAEVEVNRRAESARLRAVEKLADAA